MLSPSRHSRPGAAALPKGKSIGPDAITITLVGSMKLVRRSRSIDDGRHMTFNLRQDRLWVRIPLAWYEREDDSPPEGRTEFA